MVPTNQSASPAPQPRKIVGILAIVIFLAFAITQIIVISIEHTPLSSPTTAEEALQNLDTARFKNMTGPAKNEYLAKSALLIDELASDKRRDLFRKYRLEDENRTAMIATIARREFQKAIAYSQAATPEEKARLVEAQVDKDLARFASLSPEFRNRVLLSPSIQPSFGSLPGNPAHPPPFGMPGGGWFSRIRNYVLESPEYQTPENAKIAREFQSVVTRRIAQRIPLEQPAEQPATLPSPQ